MLRSALGVVFIASAITGCSGPDTPAPAAPPPSPAPMASPSAMTDASTPYASPGAFDAYGSPLPGGTPMSDGSAPLGGPGGIAAPIGTMASPTAEAIAAAAIPAKDKLVWMQVMLDRAHFSPGEIDGLDGTSHHRAVAAFARARSIAPEAVPAALVSDGSPMLTSYAVTTEDVAGPFKPIPEDMMKKAALEKLGYTSALEALGEKFHSTPKLLQRLNPGKRLDRAGEVIQVPNVHLTAPLGKAAKVVVDDSDGSVTALDAQGNVRAAYPATMGSQHDPLPISATGRSTASARTPRSTTIPTCSGTPRRRTRRRSSRPDRTIPWAWSGSTSRKSTTASMARRSPRRSGRRNPTAASA